MENKRIWAMVGVVYMILITLLMTYWIATTSFLTGITGIMLTPLCLGMTVQCFNNRWKARRGMIPGSPVIYTVLGLGCAAASVLMLVIGIDQLMAAF